MDLFSPAIGLNPFDWAAEQRIGGDGNRSDSSEGTLVTKASEDEN